MIAGMSPRMFRAHTMTVGLRQQVVVRTNPVMSKRVARCVTLILCVTILVVFSVSQFLHWRIVSSLNQLDQLQSVRNQNGSENISLLARKARLASKEYVATQVSTKFQLFVPGKDQVHRL
jgi:hypothetical protein